MEKSVTLENIGNCKEGIEIIVNGNTYYTEKEDSKSVLRVAELDAVWLLSKKGIPWKLPKGVKLTYTFKGK